MSPTRSLAIASLLALGLLTPFAPAQSVPTPDDKPRDYVLAHPLDGKWQYFETFPIASLDTFGVGPKLDLLGSRHMASLLLALRQLNLTPTFTLTHETRKAILALHKTWHDAYLKFREDHAADLQQWDAELSKARAAKDPKKLADTLERRTALAAQAPKIDDTVKAIRATLTPEQSQLLDTRLAEFAAEEKTQTQREAAFQKYIQKQAEKLKDRKTSPPASSTDSTLP